MTNADLVVEELACRRGERLVFAGLSFRLAPGDAVILTGANGGGKTSLLRLLAGLIKPVGGRLAWGEAPISGDIAGHHAQLHYFGHQDGVKPGLTARETLVFWAALRGREVRPDAPALLSALSAFALEAVVDWPCRWLSAGQRRRLALARLLVTPAPLWLLDEPFSALDDDNRIRLEQTIVAHRAEGGRAVVATHIPADIGAAVGIDLDAYAPRHGDAGEH